MFGFGRRRDVQRAPVAAAREAQVPLLSADAAFVTWRAYPAAGRITIEGRRMTGPTIKLTGVKMIRRGGGRGYIVAIDKEGAEHRLAV